MVKKLIDELSRGWCDAEIHGVRWEGSGRDIVVRASFLSFDGKNENIRELKCTWVRNLNFDLSYGEVEGGMPLVVDASIYKLSETSMHVEVRFGSAGEISFTCYQCEWLDES